MASVAEVDLIIDFHQVMILQCVHENLDIAMQRTLESKEYYVISTHPLFNNHIVLTSISLSMIYIYSYIHEHEDAAHDIVTW